MLKMGIRSQDGFIYFNELLYRLMKYKYSGKFKLNQSMKVKELTMQYKLYELTYRAMNENVKGIEQEFVNAYEKGGNKNSVNPFLT